MFTLPLILVAGGLSTLTIGAPLQAKIERDSFIHSVQERATSSYKVYTGDGNTNVGWPTQSVWISSFDTMYVLTPFALDPSADMSTGSIIKTVS